MGLMAISDRYSSYTALQAMEREGVDYRIEVCRGPSGLAIMAPHGGDIEPGTSEVATALASSDHSLYLFEGTKDRDNRRLHLASIRFDEPRAVHLARESAMVVTIHGCSEKEAVVMLGGRHVRLVSRVGGSLLAAGFPVDTRTGLQGLHPRNLCNCAKGGEGVQIELSSGLRRRLFMDLTRWGRRWTTSVFHRFVAAVTVALSEYTDEMALSYDYDIQADLPGVR